MTKRILQIVLVLLLLAGIAAFCAYQYLITPPDVPLLANPVNNKGTKDWKAAEAAVQRNPLKNLYFGDLHVHTNFSMDAFLTGNNRTADDAYLFAKGNPIDVVGNKIQLKQALDFTAVTDHSEFLGEMYTYQDAKSPSYNTFLPKYIRSIKSEIAANENVGERFRDVVYSPLVRQQHSKSFEGYHTTKNNWTLLLEAAEKHYEPGKFTTLAAYEWTFGLIGHIHRNVIFRDMVVPDYPISSFEARDEEQFWNSLQKFTDEGATVLAIPHNSNLSRGAMFTTTMPNGDPITKSYAQLRQKFEPLVEVHQNKGNSEVYADFWKNDEFADFENYYEGALTRNSFVRDALKQGLKYEAQLGANPFKYGMIGSTDTHNSTPGSTEEDKGMPGQFGYSDASAKVRSTQKWAISGDRPAKKVYKAVNPGGLVAVWATANTRGEIYDGLASKETYATSGNRMQVRFFGGYDFKESYENYDSLVTAGYASGVPMGSDLNHSTTTNNRPPSFLIWAAKDPETANLERIQVIKGWYDGEALQEKIYNVAIAENSKAATVDLKTGQFDTTKGAAQLQTVWSDPDFNANQRAFYYLRVLEIPTARWTLWDEIKYGVKYPAEVPKTITERAWSSPIWYSPKE